VHRLIPIVLTALLCACAPAHDAPRLEGGLHTRLPSSPEYTRLVVRAYVGELTVCVDGQRVYAFRDPASTGRLTLHVVRLPAGSAGKRIDFAAPRPPHQETLVGAVYLATDGTLPFALHAATTSSMRADAADIVLGFVLVVIGIIACAASLIRRRGDVLVLRAFGAFTLLYGARLIVNSALPFFFGASGRHLSFAEAFITYVIPVAGWALPLRLIGNGWKSTLRLQVVAFAAFAPVGILSDVITGTPSSLEIVNNVLVVVGGLNVLFNLLRAEHRRSPELRIVLAGTLVFLAFTFNNNLRNLGMLPWDYDGEAPGFVVFVAALGFAATRVFVRGERERVAIDSELKTARDIQLSILPRSVPQVPGLSFETGYVPATSVGGDMYSFLSTDSGAGVLVADVAGHGVPAALIASMVKIAVSSQERLADDPAALIGELNAILRRDVRRAFVTATYLWIDIARRTARSATPAIPHPCCTATERLRSSAEPASSSAASPTRTTPPSPRRSSPATASSPTPTASPKRGTPATRCSARSACRSSCGAAGRG
jgi:sigma-B regulation protein RsbU (phosphoserine phosphatase)